MSFQQQQPPSLVYPNTANSSSNASPSSHSSGSFGTVFIVLAVIVVVSAVACFLSRLCIKRHHHHSPDQNHHGLPLPRLERREPNLGHHSSFDDGENGNIEFGFGKGHPNRKQFGNGIRKEAKGKPQVRFEFGGDPTGGGERELKGGQFSAI